MDIPYRLWHFIEHSENSFDQLTQLTIGNIERVQELIKSLDINGHDSDDYFRDTALIKASAAGKLLISLYFKSILFLIWIFFTSRTRKYGYDGLRIVFQFKKSD